MHGKFDPVKYDVSIEPVAGGGFDVIVTEDDEVTRLHRSTLPLAQKTAACLPLDVCEYPNAPWSVFCPTDAGKAVHAT